MSRPSPDYPMLPTIPLSAFSDPKKTKTSHVSKVGRSAAAAASLVLARPRPACSKCHHLVGVIDFGLERGEKNPGQTCNHCQLFLDVSRVAQMAQERKVETRPNPFRYCLSLSLFFFYLFFSPCVKR